MTQADRNERLAAVATMVTLGLILSTVIELPIQRVALNLFGSELSLVFSGPIQLMGMISILVCAGAHLLVGRHASDTLADTSASPSLPLRLATSAMYWGLPMLLVVLGLLLIQRAPWRGYQIALAVITGLLVSGTLTLQMATVSALPPRFKGQQILLQALVYATAYGLFYALFFARLRSLISATAVLITSLLLSLELLRFTNTSVWRIWLYASLVGLVMGELTWGLNYTRLNAHGGGIILLSAFYAAVGIVQQNLWDRLTPRTLAEYLLLLGIGVSMAIIL